MFRVQLGVDRREAPSGYPRYRKVAVDTDDLSTTLDLELDALEASTLHVSICIYLCIQFTCVYVHVCVHLLYMCLCACMCMYVCMYVCMCMYVCI